MKKQLLTLIVVAIATVPAMAQQQIRVTIENLQPADGFYLTPVFLGFHDGSFDYFDVGSTASPELEALAEEGMTGGLAGLFSGQGFTNSTTVTSPGGFAGAPVFDPGEVQSVDFNLAASERFASFATMIIPSNDSFFGNDDGTAIELLDAMGNYTGDRVLEFSLADLYDAGTELNDGLGAAFSANGGTATDTTDNITQGPDLSNFNTTGTADGTTINFANASASPNLRISITAIPEPTSGAILGIGALGLALIRRRK